MPKSTKPIGVHSRRNALRKIDGRTAQGRFLRQTQRELIAHLGGSDRVSAPQRYMVERVAIDLLRLRLLDAEMAEGTFSALDGRIAHALRNSVRLALRELGFTPRQASVDPVAQFHAKLAEIDARKGAP